MRNGELREFREFGEFRGGIIFCLRLISRRLPSTVCKRKYLLKLHIINSEPNKIAYKQNGGTNMKILFAPTMAAVGLILILSTGTSIASNCSDVRVTVFSKTVPTIERKVDLENAAQALSRIQYRFTNANTGAPLARIPIHEREIASSTTEDGVQKNARHKDDPFPWITTDNGVAPIFFEIAHAAAVNTCQDSPRNVGLFSAMDRTKGTIEISRELQDQLPKAHMIREAKQTNLTASGEQVIIYDTDDGLQVAIIAQGVVIQTYDLSKLVKNGQGGIYATSCEFQLSPTQKAFAVAYTLSEDGTGSAFMIMTWVPETKYELVYHQAVGQGRIVLGSGKMDLWESTRGKNASRPESPKFECE
jgi:hypothetical protein